MASLQFEITNDEEAKSTIDGINDDLSNVPCYTKDDSLMILIMAQSSISDLIKYYKS